MKERRYPLSLFLNILDCDNVLSECDDAFYNYEDDLEALNHEYLMKYREFFN